MTTGCRRFYFVQPDDDCWQIATDVGIPFRYEKTPTKHLLVYLIKY